MTMGEPRLPRIPVAVVDVVTQHWQVVPDKKGGPGVAKVCLQCPEGSYYGFFKVPGMPPRRCPNCDSWLVNKEPS